MFLLSLAQPFIWEGWTLFSLVYYSRAARRANVDKAESRSESRRDCADTWSVADDRREKSALPGSKSAASGILTDGSSALTGEILTAFVLTSH